MSRTDCNFVVHFLCPTREGFKDEQGNLKPYSECKSSYDSWGKVQQAISWLPKDRILVRIEQVKTITKEVSIEEFADDTDRPVR